MDVYNLLLRRLMIVVLIGLLAACTPEEGDDLDQFIATAANNMSKSVPPLPEVLPYTPLQYNVDGALDDPFRARKDSCWRTLKTKY